MNEEKFFEALQSKNPKLRKETVALTQSGFKQLVFSVYNYAHKVGMRNGAALERERAKKEMQGQVGVDALKDIFGGFRS